MYTQSDPLVTFFTWFWGVFFTLCAIGYIGGLIGKARRGGRPAPPVDVAALRRQRDAARARSELLRQQRQAKRAKGRQGK
jgi:hypothetical protein